MEVRDPRCIDGDCLFPQCSCEFPPHDEEPSPLENDGLMLGMIVTAAIIIAAGIVFSWFYVVNEVL